MKLLIKDQAFELAINLALISKIEETHGSLYQIAEGLLDRSLPITKIIGILKMIYQYAGCDVTEDVLLQQPCSEILSSFLIEVLNPIDRMEAVMVGEILPAQNAE